VPCISAAWRSIQTIAAPEASAGIMPGSRAYACSSLLVSSFWEAGLTAPTPAGQKQNTWTPVPLTSLRATWLRSGSGLGQQRKRCRPAFRGHSGTAWWSR
jgi:hypothetical protein